MTEEGSTNSHLSVAMTTTGMTQSANNMTSSSSRGAEFYFHCVLLVIGVVGTATNGLILYAMVASKQHKKHVLIVNQNVLDLLACFFIFTTFSLKLCNIHLSGSLGYWLCTLLLSGCLIWFGTTGSVFNLASISIERYLKVVHSTWSKTKLRSWMIYSAVAFSWIASLIYNAALVFPTTDVIDGVCYPYAIWESDTAILFEFVWNFVTLYVNLILILIFCYWRILIVIRRQARVMSSHAAAGSNTAQTQYHQIQCNVTKTMIFICAFHAISWLPTYIYLVIMRLNLYHAFAVEGYYLSLIIAHLYTCTNPFVYAIKFEPVKEALLRMIPCKKITE